MSPAAEVKGGDGVGFCPLEGEGVGVVADYYPAAGVEGTVFGGVDDGLESGSGVGGEDAEVE